MVNEEDIEDLQIQIVRVRDRLQRIEHKIEVMERSVRSLTAVKRLPAATMVKAKGKP